MHPYEPMSEASMEAALNLHSNRTRARGAGLLLHHCAWIGGADEPRLPARTRLDVALGSELATLLVGALSPAVQGLRGSSSP
jgi:hypothetical protein